MHSTCAGLEGEWGTNFINLHSKITEICLGKINYPSDPQPPPRKIFFDPRMLKNVYLTLFKFSKCNMCML